MMSPNDQDETAGQGRPAVAGRNACTTLAIFAIVGSSRKLR
jgi:hypothetical protein